MDAATSLDWDVAAASYIAVVLLPAATVNAEVAEVLAGGIEAFGTDGRCSVGESFTPQTLAKAAGWLREQGAERIELRADPRHCDMARVAVSFTRETGISLTDLGGVPGDVEAREHRALTTSTLLIVAADAVFTPIRELGFFEELLLEEAGGWEQRAIAECRAVSGWERRVAMLHGAVRPAMTAILAEPHRAMVRAAMRILPAVPYVGMKDAKQLEEWDSDCVMNFAGRVVETAKARGGRGPERIVVVVRESDEWVEDALGRAAWMLDEARVEIISVDACLGLLERDIALLWSEEDAAAHASNLAAILADRQDGPL
ncbi:hypothetical protein [Microbacterium maritypicum]